MAPATDLTPHIGFRLLSHVGRAGRVNAEVMLGTAADGAPHGCDCSCHFAAWKAHKRLLSHKHVRLVSFGRADVRSNFATVFECRDSGVDRAVRAYLGFRIVLARSYFQCLQPS